MKIFVDSLPYYGDECLFEDKCYLSKDPLVCPRHWDKYKVCSEDNPRECCFLKEQTDGNDNSREE